MPSLKQTRGKRATPIAITAEKGPWSEWLKLNAIKTNSRSTIATATMTSADPINAPEQSKTAQMPRPLTFFDLPTETQKEIIQQCTLSDLVSLSLVSKYFRDLAAAQIYRNFHIVFPDDDDGTYESDLDGLAAGLDTFATSEYDYARYLREIILETLSGGAKGERACRQYTNDLSCGKFMNTLFLLTLRKAKALETFKWDVRIELSRPVYKALHSIPALQHLHLRMHSGKSIYQSPPPLQSLGLTQSSEEVEKNVAGLLTYLKSGMSLRELQGKSIFSLTAKDPSGHGPPTISGFTNLKSLSVLDMDSLEYVLEIKTCIQNSSSTLNKLELSFSDSLARQARKPPPVDDTGDESDQEIDEFGNMIPPPPAVALPSTEDSSPAKAFTAQEAKKAQEAALGRIFGIEAISNPQLKMKEEDLSSTSASDDEKEADSEFENAGKDFIRDLGRLSEKLMVAVSGATRTQQQKDLLNIIEKAAKKYVAEKRRQRIEKSGQSGSAENSTAGSSTAKATPVSSSVASVTDKADEEDKPKDSEPEEKSAGLFDGEDKKPRKTNHHSNDSSNPDDIDIYEPEEGPDSHESEMESASDLFVGEAGDDLKPVEQTVVSNKLSEVVAATGERLGETMVSEEFAAKGLETEKLIIPSNVLNETDIDEKALKEIIFDIVKEKLTTAQMDETGQGDDTSPEGKGRTVSQSSSENPLHKQRHAMNEYVRTTRGLTLKTLAIYLIPIKTSVLSRAVDLHALRRISLLNVGPQASFWNYLAKENKILPLPLCKIHTDNVTMPFLNFVNQLDNLVELFMLEHTRKSSEYSFAPKTTVTNDNIRRLVLKKHISSLKRLVIKNENDYSWDANERLIELLCRKGKNLKELGICFGSHAMHTFDQYLPGLISLKALHIINFRNDDTCHWVMREVRRFIVDVVSNHPNMKLVYIALGGSVERLVWQVPKVKSKATLRLKDKGKGKVTTSGVPSTGAQSPFPSLEAAMLTAEKGEYSSTDESDGDDGYTPGLKLETVDSGRFYDVYGVHMWKKDILLGGL